MDDCIRAKPLLLNASPFLNPKLEVYENKKRRNPEGELASYTHFILCSFCFYFMARSSEYLGCHYSRWAQEG